MTRRQHTAAALSVTVILSLGSSPPTAGQRETPELTSFERFNEAGQPAWVLREPDTGMGYVLGAAFLCRSAEGPQVAVYLGPFPPDRRPTQLAVRRTDGRIERFGPVTTAGPEAGFNDTLLLDTADVRRFTEAALENGSLVSNGYNSFWNMTPPRENNGVMNGLRRCGL